MLLESIGGMVSAVMVAPSVQCARRIYCLCPKLAKDKQAMNNYFYDLSPEEYDQMIQLSNNFGQMLD